MKRIALLLVFNSLVWSGIGQEPPTILIQTFSADSREIAGWQQSFGQALTDMTIAEVKRDGRFVALAPERQSDNSGSEGKARLPDLLLVGTVTRFGAETRTMDASSPHS